MKTVIFSFIPWQTQIMLEKFPCISIQDALAPSLQSLLGETLPCAHIFAVRKVGIKEEIVQLNFSAKY